jgi:hypothetical protein
MVTIEPIEHGGRVVALVTGGRALIADGLGAYAVAVVRAKCLYALDVQAGERPGRYTDAAATRYAQLAHAAARACRARQRR